MRSYCKFGYYMSAGQNQPSPLIALVLKGGLSFDSTGHFMTVINIELASNYVHFWT